MPHSAPSPGRRPADWTTVAVRLGRVAQAVLLTGLALAATACGVDTAPREARDMLPRGEADVARWNAWRRTETETPDLRGEDLRGYALASTDFSEVDLREADLRDARLRNAVFDGAHLKSAQVEGADLAGASFTGADLRWVDLRGAEVRGADLSEADLRAADLTGVDLTGVDLRRADLRGALLHGADLRGARVDDADMRGAVADTSTAWPPKFRYYRAQVRMERAARPSVRPGSSAARRVAPPSPRAVRDGAVEGADMAQPQ